MKLALLMLLALAPLGCERAAAERNDAVVAARVNGMEISLHEVRGARGSAVRQALDKVIDRELVVQQALRDGLDKDPLVAEALENARRQALADAWIDRQSASASSQTEILKQQVRAFYAENPALFAERRIYRLGELVVHGAGMDGEIRLDVLHADAAASADLEALAARLRLRNLRFASSAQTQPAEALPLAWLPRLARMQPGDIAVFPSPAGASVVQLMHAEAAPLGEAQAAPLIEQFLAGKRRLEVAASEVKRLREAARIEYIGEFKAR